MNIFGFILTILPIALSPGASFTLGMTNVMNRGIKGLLSIIIGTSLGIYTHALLVGLGVTGIVTKYPFIINIIQIIGTIYLIYLSYTLIKNGIYSEKNSAKKVTKKNATIKDAYIANIMNIKAIILYLTVAPSYLTSNHINVSNFIILASIHIIIMTIWLLVFGYVIIFTTKKMNFSSVSRFINIMGGVCLLYFSLSPYFL
ncbi:LysE family translocator [Xenorhabdus doucetiae]|uniref:Lysine exporter protein (LYSE/YGGA) n=1 Tax=Xenorhabdus doucetiae TaxID=351671 RepID=A0A068QP10_9GAMM|nr:LysE family translocator [Xenorhabdus doucetiae]TYP00394.1 threonine/homoserine/homoserine lactone efflux protein [Xenorhabdus doucetiae]CDG16698.1 Lysine exporter protein (LYSE/YGGA) [Xenorhabdus doucetiae]